MPEIMRKPLCSQSINHQAFFPQENLHRWTIQAVTHSKWHWELVVKTLADIMLSWKLFQTFFVLLKSNKTFRPLYSDKGLYKRGFTGTVDELGSKSGHFITKYVLKLSIYHLLHLSQPTTEICCSTNQDLLLWQSRIVGNVVMLPKIANKLFLSYNKVDNIIACIFYLTKYVSPFKPSTVKKLELNSLVVAELDRMLL